MDAIAQEILNAQITIVLKIQTETKCALHHALQQLKWGNMLTKHVLAHLIRNVLLVIASQVQPFLHKGHANHHAQALK